MNTVRDNTFQVMGSLEKDRAAPYYFSIAGLLKEGWRRVNGMKACSFGAVALWYLTVIPIVLISMIGAFIFISSPTLQTIFVNIVDFILFAVMITLSTGIGLLGVRRSVDLPLKATSIFSYFHYTPKLIGAWILQVLILTTIALVGIISFIFFPYASYTSLSTFTLTLLWITHSVCAAVFIYLIFAGIFINLLIVEKKLGIWGAYKASFLAYSQHWFKITALVLISIMIYIISAIPLGIGLIWTTPMMINLFGILYRIAFGVEAVR